jgi:threonyl-tRNA synthetase
MENHEQNNAFDINYKLRHSAAHLLAAAVLELFPNTQLTIGPVTENGFFYDFLPEKNFIADDLPRIEEKMREIAKRNDTIEGKEISKQDALALFKNNPFKCELVNGIPDATVGIYSQGSFFDLCKGGHVDRVGTLKYFMLIGLSGSYWRADREGTALQRISGVCFATKEELEQYKIRIEEAQKYDHRKLGKQLDLFTFHEEAPGMPFFHPRGLIIYNKLIDFMRSLQNEVGYQEVKTPLILHEQLWKTSGHYDNYKDNMFFTSVENITCCVRPMNCPCHIILYNEKPHSYKELPMRISEFGLVHRFELSGVMHGLFRVRSFTQDDAHIFCTPETMEQEIIETLKLIDKAYKPFGFTAIKMAVSTRPEKYMGDPVLWEKATDALKHALQKQGIPYKIQEGEGAFYGPKIEVKVYDTMGREWQCGTVQVDFALPKNFDLEYIDTDQSRKQPVIIHRAILGSIDRFFGIILENFKGKLPFWLTPVQARVMTITDAQRPYAHEILAALKEQGIRVDIGKESEQISAQIKVAQGENIPWMLVLGNKEMEQKTITLRHLDGKQEFGLTLEDIVSRAKTLQKPV